MILVWRWIFNWNIIGEKTRETKNWCQANVSGFLSCENELRELSFENENWEQNVEEPNKAQLVKKDGCQWWLNTLWNNLELAHNFRGLLESVRKSGEPMLVFFFLKLFLSESFIKLQFWGLFKWRLWAIASDLTLLSIIGGSVKVVLEFYNCVSFLYVPTHV